AMAASSRATPADSRTWAPRKLSFTACAFCAMKITSTIRASTPAIRAVRMPLIRVRSMARCGLAAPGGPGAEPLADGTARGVPRPAGVRSARAWRCFLARDRDGRAPRAPSVPRAGRCAVPRSPRWRRSGVAPQPPADVQGAAYDGDDDQGGEDGTLLR